MRGTLWGGSISGGTEMLSRGHSGLCDGGLYKLASVKYCSSIFDPACVLCICGGKLMNPYLCSTVNAYAVN